MVRMFVRHAVEDFDDWKTVYDDFDEERKGMGVTEHAVFREVDDPRNVTVWHDFETLEAPRSMAGSDRLREVMDEAGVAEEPTIWFTESA